ncbi:MAG: isochorismatase family protein [Phycisphaerales bacterium]
MAIPRLRPETTAVLVVDVQDRLLPTIIDSAKVVNNCALLLRVARLLRMPGFVTEQYVKGLGRSAQEVTAAMPDPSWRVEKTQFSALVDLIDQSLLEGGRTQVLVAGLEAHICVLQTVLDLQATGRQVFICTDAISAGSRDQVAPALRRMEAAGAVSTGVMEATYELMRDARHPAFREALELVKQITR